MNLRLSLRAEEDLESIGDFTAKDNPARAKSFVEELQQRCQEILRNPTAYPWPSRCPANWGMGIE